MANVPTTTAVSAVPVLVYNPAPAGNPTVFITNTGIAVVYLGSSAVTIATGMPLPPGQVLDIARFPYSVYATSGYTATATATTTTAAANSGATSLVITSGTGINNGALILVGSGTNAEVTTVTSGGGTTTLTVPALNLDHRSGAAVTVVTANATAVSVVAGTV